MWENWLLACLPSKITKNYEGKFSQWFKGKLLHFGDVLDSVRIKPRGFDPKTTYYVMQPIYHILGVIKSMWGNEQLVFKLNKLHYRKTSQISPSAFIL